MKKHIIFALTLSFIAPPAFAAEILSEYPNEFDKQHLQEWSPLTIEADINKEITSKNGINLLLDKEAWILWNEAELELSGTAVTNGRVASNAKITFSKDYKSLHIPVKSDFLANETLEIDGLQIRTYEQTFSKRYLGLDINNDLKPDFFDSTSYEIEDVDKNDNTIPYPVYNVAYTLKDGQITLKWSLPPDYDLEAIQIDKAATIDGITKDSFKIYSNDGTEFTDKNLENVDKVIYKLTARDLYTHESEPVEVSIDLNAGEEPLQEPDDEVDPDNGTQDSGSLPEAELEALKKLIPYFYLRYQTDCVDQATASDYFCLWARIRLIHAQDFTDEVLVSNLSLSERDLELMTIRRKWPEMRYENDCLKANQPAPYCTALKKDLDRISYFLD